MEAKAEPEEERCPRCDKVCEDDYSTIKDCDGCKRTVCVACVAVTACQTTWCRCLDCFGVEESEVTILVTGLASRKQLAESLLSGSLPASAPQLAAQVEQCDTLAQQLGQQFKEIRWDSPIATR